MKTAQRISAIDSHTGGEPTRVIIAGGPDLGGGPLSERARHFGERFDLFRSCVINEPRGSDVLVGALLVEPHEPGCSAGVIFFNNVGTLQMCGHGTIGLTVTLAHLGRMAPGEHRIDTPVGIVTATAARCAPRHGAKRAELPAEEGRRRRRAGIGPSHR